MTIGREALRAYRLAQKLTAAEFADKLGVAEPTLRSYENGHRTMSAEFAKKAEIVTGGKLTRRKLLPEIFGPIETEEQAVNSR